MMPASQQPRWRWWLWLQWRRFGVEFGLIVFTLNFILKYLVSGPSQFLLFVYYFEGFCNAALFLFSIKKKKTKSYEIPPNSNSNYNIHSVVLITVVHTWLAIILLFFITLFIFALSALQRLNSINTWGIFFVGLRISHLILEGFYYMEKGASFAQPYRQVGCLGPCADYMCCYG